MRRQSVKASPAHVCRAGREIAVESDHPARAGNGGVGNDLQVSCGGDDGFGRRLVAQPERGGAPRAHGANEPGIGIDPGGPGGAGFVAAILLPREIPGQTP